MQQAAWLFFRKEADLKEEEREHLRLLKQASPKAETAFQLVNKFLHMVRGRTGEQLDGWLKEVEASQLQAFEPFLAGVQRDKEAILARLTLPWSNGPTEGHVNRLKLIKRSMYNRAKFDLLRHRVLYSPKNDWGRKTEKGDQKQASRKKLKGGANTLNSSTIHTSRISEPV